MSVLKRGVADTEHLAVQEVTGTLLYEARDGSDGRCGIIHKAQRMLRRLRHALVVLVIAGTVFVVWNAVDAQLAVPRDTAEAASQVRAAASINRTLAAIDRATPNPDLNSEALVQERIYTAYVRPRLVAIWERAAKAEFAVLAGAACIWLLLPRTNARVS